MTEQDVDEAAVIARAPRRSDFVILITRVRKRFVGECEMELAAVNSIRVNPSMSSGTGL